MRFLLILIPAVLMAAEPPKPAAKPTVVLTPADREPVHNAFRKLQDLRKVLAETELKAKVEIPEKIRAAEKELQVEVEKVRVKCGELADDPINLVACKPVAPVAAPPALTPAK